MADGTILRSTAVRITGSGTPEGNIAAPIGSEYRRLDTLEVYDKLAGASGPTGWTLRPPAMSAALPAGQIFVGNASGVATPVAVSGVISLDAAGATAFSSATGAGATVLAGSPALTGTPTAPTQSAGDNSTKLATTAYVAAAIAAGGGGGGVPAAHHATHEPGGSDALVALDAGILTTGLVPDARLSSAIVRTTDARLTDARTPLAHAASHAPGGSDALAVDAAAGTGSLRTLGTGALQAAAGNDARFSDARTPTAHASTHQPGGSDAMAVDATAATGSLRTLGTGALQAAAGNDARLTDARSPTAHAATHKSGGSDAIKLDELAAPTDVTTLNASSAAHGLLPKLSNVATQYLDGTGAWSTPAGGGGAPASHHATHETGGADAIVALSAAVLTSGTLPNARLDANVAITTSLAVGTNVAAAGAIRLANATTVSARNAANTADLALVGTNTSNEVTLGSSSTGGTFVRGGAGGVTVATAGDVNINGNLLYFGPGGAPKWYLNTSGHWVPLSDNAYDIGISGAARVRAGYFGTVEAGVLNATTGFRVANAAGSGKVLRGNGTNFVPSTLTIPDTLTQFSIPYASGTNMLAESTALRFAPTPSRLAIGTGAAFGGPALEVNESISGNLLQFWLRNPASGAGTGSAIQIGNSTSQSIAILQATPNTGTSTPWTDDGFIFQAGLGNLHLAATASGKEIRFHAGQFTHTFTMDSASNFYPIADGVGKCGAFGVKWKEIWATNGAIFTSDARDKHAIEDADLGLAFIRALRAVRYTPNAAPGERRYGLLAQQVLEALGGRQFDGLVVESNGHYGLSYAALIGPIIKAIQELAQALERAPAPAGG